MKYDENDKRELIKEGAKSFNISIEQSEKRVNKLIQAIDNGLFDGIPEKGPSDFLQHMFVQVKTRQFMETNVD